MLTYLRYALATFCFAVSVGCLALWWRSHAYRYEAAGPSYVSSTYAINLGTAKGFGIAGITKEIPPFTHRAWKFRFFPVDGSIGDFNKAVKSQGAFGLFRNWWYFPLWYPALIIALAGVASLRLGRRFTIRSAIIATTVVAVLLGMAVIL